MRRVNCCLDDPSPGLPIRRSNVGSVAPRLGVECVEVGGEISHWVSGTGHCVPPEPKALRPRLVYACELFVDPPLCQIAFPPPPVHLSGNGGQPAVRGPERAVDAVPLIEGDCEIHDLHRHCV